MRLKQIAVEVARSQGWEAETEVSGQTPTGLCWTADVLAHRATARIAIEIQWSGQTTIETERRHAQYAESGVRALWLMRKLAAPVAEAIPAVRISQTEQGTFNAHIGEPCTEQTVPIREFLKSAFQGRLKFGLPIGAQVSLSIQVGTSPCWACGTFTRMITDVDVRVGPHKFNLAIADFDGARGLLSPILQHLPNGLEVGEIRPRYSKTVGRSYLSNGCAHCDALFGQFIFDAEAFQNRETVLTVMFPLSEEWRRLLNEQDDCCSWGVFDFDVPGLKGLHNERG